jgi:hypothetical protein
MMKNPKLKIQKFKKFKVINFYGENVGKNFTKSDVKFKIKICKN